MKNVFKLLLLVLVFSVYCDEGSSERRIIVSKEFIDNNTYEIVCNGYPKDTLTGIARTASAKRAALLNAYMHVQKEFKDTILPDRDGRVKKYEFGEDHATVYYTIKKTGLKSHLK